MTLLLLLCSLCLGMGILLLGFSVARSAVFPSLIMTPYERVQDHSFQLNNEDCEILIYGDSSTMTADDPLAIAEKTGLKTCNISQTQPIVMVTGTVPVELYLKQNKLPKYLVLQFAPETFYQPHTLDRTVPFDPMTVMLRQNSRMATARLFLRYPRQTIQYVSLVLQDRYKPNRTALAAFNELYKPVLAEYAKTGLMTLPKPSETSCGPEKPLPETPDFGWLDEARRKYSALGVKVLVTVSPIPECDSERATYQSGLDGYLDGEVSTLPLNLFNDSDRHFTREGAAIVSAQVAQEIQALETSTAK